jgi:hypothetical protein
LTCRRALFRSRWPKGFRCPVCERRGHSRFRREGLYYQYSACRHQTTALSGTVFQATKLPLTSFDNASITDGSKRRLAPEAEAFTDGLGAFGWFVDTGHAHTVLETEGGRAATEVRGARWVKCCPTSSARSGAPITRSNNASTTERGPFSGRAPLPWRSCLPPQSPFPPARTRAAIASCHGPLRPLCRACSASGKQFSELRIGANQVPLCRRPFFLLKLLLLCCGDYLKVSKKICCAFTCPSPHVFQTAERVVRIPERKTEWLEHLEVSPA